MSQLTEILIYNENFVKNKGYQPYIAGKYPKKKMVILTCMDTRLTELLPKAMNVHNGDIKLLKTAGALITEPYGSIMRSLLVAVSLLKAKEIYVVGHHDCGMTGLRPENALDALIQMGISREMIERASDSTDIDRWLSGPRSVEEAVFQSISVIQSHPLFPPTIPVHGLTIEPKTGKLDLILNGNK